MSDIDCHLWLALSDPSLRLERVAPREHCFPPCRMFILKLVLPRNADQTTDALREHIRRYVRNDFVTLLEILRPNLLLTA